MDEYAEEIGTRQHKGAVGVLTNGAVNRDEMFSHILRCGVIEALPEHQKDWFDDTMQYIADRYEDLADEQLGQLRQLGERYCQPVQRRVEPVGSA